MSLRKAQAIGAVAACLALSFAALTTPSAVAADTSYTPADGFLYPGDILTVSAGDPTCYDGTGTSFGMITNSNNSVTASVLVSTAGDFTIPVGPGGSLLPLGRTVTLTVACYSADSGGGTSTLLVPFTSVTVTVAAGMPAATAAPSPVLTTGTVTITGTNFKPNEAVTLHLGNTTTPTLASANADPSGVVTFAVPISDPNSDGTTTDALAVGTYSAILLPESMHVASTSFVVQAPAPPPGPTSGTMPRLGSDVA